LTKNEFYFAFPQELNDPFDCYLYSEYYGNESEWKNYFDRLPFSQSKIKVFKFVKSLNFDNNLINKHLAINNRNNYSEIGVLSCLQKNVLIL